MTIHEVESREIAVTTDEGTEHRVTYFIEQTDSDNEFNCDMYNVGVKQDNEESIIRYFSPTLSEAEELLEMLYRNFATPEQLFSIAETFVE